VAQCVCGGGGGGAGHGGRQPDLSDPDVADAALKIQGAIKGMLHRQRVPEPPVDADQLAAADDADLPDVGGDGGGSTSRQGSQASALSAGSRASARSGHGAVNAVEKQVPGEDAAGQATGQR